MKWKMSMVPFHLDLTIFLLCSQCLAFHLKFESDVFGRSQMISVNDTAWLPVGVCWWHEVALCLLWMSCCLWYILERGCACPVLHKSALSSQLSFPFIKLFSAFLPWRTNSLVGKSPLWWFRHFLSVHTGGAAVLSSGGLCHSKVGDSFLPLSLLTLLRASLPPGVIPHSRTALAVSGESIWQVCSFLRY